MSKQANENVTNINTDNTKTAEKRVRLDMDGLKKFVGIWQQAVIDGDTLTECVETMQIEISPDMSNKQASTQAASLRKMGVELRNFRKAGLPKADISSLQELAQAFNL